MSKKFLILFFIFSTLASALFYFFIPGPSLFTEEACPFCNAQILNAQTFYEDSLVRALYTHKPVFPGHCLIVPQRHVKRFEGLTEEEISQMGKTIKRVDRAVSKTFGTSAYLLLQKNGREVGQSVPHVHFHYIPRKAEEDSAFLFLFHMYFANGRKPMDASDMEKNVSLLREAMEEEKAPSR